MKPQGTVYEAFMIAFLWGWFAKTGDGWLQIAALSLAVFYAVTAFSRSDIVRAYFKGLTGQ